MIFYLFDVGCLVYNLTKFRLFQIIGLDYALLKLRFKLFQHMHWCLLQNVIFNTCLGRLCARKWEDFRGSFLPFHVNVTMLYSFIVYVVMNVPFTFECSEKS